MGAVWDALAARGAFEPADPALVGFQADHTTIGPDGLRYIRFPPGTPEELTIDCAVAYRPILSSVGHRLLEAHSISRSA